jgi:hypothetical protein
MKIALPNRNIISYIDLLSVEAAGIAAPTDKTIQTIFTINVPIEGLEQNKYVEIDDKLIEGVESITFKYIHKNCVKTAKWVKPKNVEAPKQKIVHSLTEVPQNLQLQLRHKSSDLYEDTDQGRLRLLSHIDELIAVTSSVRNNVIRSDKNLVYFSVYFDTGYVELLDLSLKTLFFEKTTCFDVLIITDRETRQKIEQLNILNYFNVHFLITDTPADGVEASMNKCLLYDFERIYDYGKIFLLDADIMCVKNADIIFKIPIVEGQIYPARQTKLTQESFKKFYHGFSCIPDSFVQEMVTLDQLPFNAGQFLFLNSSKMQQHFKNIKAFIDNWAGEYFYEQCFFNYYFCKAKMVMSREMERFVALYCGSNEQKSGLTENTRLIHFIGPSSDAKAKLQYIEQWLDKKHYALQFKK